MRGGFSFCGVDIADLGLEYAPSLSDTYVFGNSGYDVHQEEFDGHHGGYLYGTTVKPKDFMLRCYFEDAHIAAGILAKVEGFFSRGRTGKLIFDKRDWLWYTATVVGIDTRDLRNYKNGFVTINMRAFYPFARHDYCSIGADNRYAEYLAKNSGLLKADMTPETAVSAPISSSTSLLLYNGGTENASVAIAIAGNAGEGVTITNKTTNQACRFVAFTKADTTNAGKHIILDGMNGKTMITDGTEREYCFLYHDYGFIELAPSFPIERDVTAAYKQNESAVRIQNLTASDSAIGKHIYLENGWRKIVGIDEIGKYTVDHTFLSNGSSLTDIVTMNEIDIELSYGAELTKLEFIYKPTFQ